jgi:hypothetical protein
MASAREHMKNTHGQEQARWGELAKAFGEMGEHVRDLHKKTGMAGESDLAADCDKVSGIAQAHSDFHGSAFEECSKATDAEDLHKRMQAADQERQNARLVPTEVFGAIPDHPNIRAVPRAGQPAPAPVKPNVPLEFEKVFAVDDDE